MRLFKRGAFGRSTGMPSKVVQLHDHRPARPRMARICRLIDGIDDGPTLALTARLALNAAENNVGRKTQVVVDSLAAAFLAIGVLLGADREALEAALASVAVDLGGEP